MSRWGGGYRTLSEFIFILIAFLFSFYFLPLGVDAHHDGYLFNMALSIRRGGVIYVDYTNIYGPLTAYTHALFMGIFGDTLYVMRVSAIPFLLASFIFFYRIFIRWIPHWYLLFAQSLLLVIGTGFNTGWSSIYALCFSLLAADFMIRYFEYGKIRFCALSAVFAMITFLYRSPVGFCIILSGPCALIYLGLIKERKWSDVLKHCLIYIAFLAITISPFIVLFIVQGCIKNWLSANVFVLIKPGSLAGLREESIDSIKNIASKIDYVVGTRDRSGSGVTAEKFSTFVSKLFSSPTFGKFFKLIICLFPIYPFNSLVIWVLLPIVSIITFFGNFFTLIKKKKIINISESGSEETSKTDSENKRIKILHGILAIYAIASWAQYYPSGNHIHWYCSCFLMYGILIYQILNFCRKIHNVKIARVLQIMVPLILSGQVCYFLYFATGIDDMNAKLIGDTSLHNKIYSMKYHNVVYKGSNKYLHGIRMSPDQIDFYEGISTKLSELLIENPDAVVYLPYYNFNILGTFCIDTRNNKGNTRIYIDGKQNAERYKDLKPVYSQKVKYKSESYLEKNGDVINIYVIKDN